MLLPKIEQESPIEGHYYQFLFQFCPIFGYLQCYTPLYYIRFWKFQERIRCFISQKGNCMRVAHLVSDYKISPVWILAQFFQIKLVFLKTCDDCITGSQEKNSCLCYQSFQTFSIKIKYMWRSPFVVNRKGILIC